MASADEKQLAYNAGKAAFETEPAHRCHPDSCPFEPGTEERDAWLSGFSDALESQPKPADLAKAVKEAKGA